MRNHRISVSIDRLTKPSNTNDHRNRRPLVHYQPPVVHETQLPPRNETATLHDDAAGRPDKKKKKSLSLLNQRGTIFFTDIASNRTNERTPVHAVHPTCSSNTRWTIHAISPFLSARPSVSLRGDINCLLPNLIRNFRRRGNLTSFLFSLARSRARCWRGSRSQDFSIHDRSRAGSNQTTGHPRFNLINLYRCVTYAYNSASLSLSRSIFSLRLSPVYISSLSSVVLSGREKMRRGRDELLDAWERDRDCWEWGEEQRCWNAVDAVTLPFYAL